jgi:hypothetical protein
MTTNAKVRSARTVSWQAADPDLWVVHTCGVRFGLDVMHLSRLVALDIPAEPTDEAVNAALAEVLHVDDSWLPSDDAESEQPPTVRPTWRTVALIDAAPTQLADQICRSVLALDRALALDGIGRPSDAASLAVRFPYTIVEVAELIHDAELAEGPLRADVIRLLEFVEDAAFLEDLINPTGPIARTNGAVENMLREVLTPHGPPVFLDETEAQPTAPSPEELRLAWRTERRIRAVHQSLVEVESYEHRRRAANLVKAHLQGVGHEMASRVLELSLSHWRREESEPDPKPLLSEVIHCLVTSEPALAHGLDDAVRRDAEGNADFGV